MKAMQQQRAWMEERLNHLKTLRDEIRVDLHLAGMEAKDRWAQLEPKLEDAERLMEQVSETSRRGLDELTESFRTFRESVRRHDKRPQA